MKQINITLTEQQIVQIEQRMQETGLSRSEILRRAIDEYLQRVRGYDAPPMTAEKRLHT